MTEYCVSGVSARGSLARHIDKGTEMIKISALVLGAALVAGGVASASAADLHGHRGGSIKDSYAAAPVASGPSGWYVRADVGHARYDDPTMIEDGRFTLTNRSIEDNWAIGGGVGYYFSRSVRGDLTWDHRFKSDVRGSIPFVGGGQLTDFPGERQFGMKSDVFLANLYYDFDMRSRFTPYIGMGLGVTHNKTTAGSVPDFLDPCGCGFTNVSIAGASQWSVAGALMAGASFNVRDRLHIDAGYRFLYLGDAHTGVMTGTKHAAFVAPQFAGGVGDPVVSDIYAHEFRVGLRYDIK